MMDAMHASTVTFETPIGRCAIRWTEAGIARVLLPRASGREGAAYETGLPVPGFVGEAIEGIVALLSGEPRDLRGVPLDWTGIDDFRRDVYAATREVGPGSTASYGQIANGIGRADAARDVGTALARNPFAIVVPCHRIVAANGALTGFSAPGGIALKRKMLELEGAPGYGQQLLFA